MILLKVFGIIVLGSLTVTELITFKPFIKSRYSLRTRAKITTKPPHEAKINETGVNVNPEANIQHGSIQQSPTQHLASTMMTSVNPIATLQPDTPVVKIDTTSTPSELISEKNKATTQSAPTEPPIVEVKTTTSPATTASTEWVYDYYASDDESPKKE